jgi:AcrR family transcriptional regulator
MVSIFMAPAKNPRPSARDRILETASRLFYQEGVHNVGIDRIIAESGVAKMSLYNHFKSKDALIEAWLRQRDENWRTWFQAAVERLAETPEARLLAVFDALQEWFEQPNFRGCAFINSTVELVNPDHPGYQVALEHQQAMVDYLLGLAQAAGVAEPDDLVRQLLILIEGAIVVAMMQDTSTSAMAAKQVAALLVGKGVKREG